MKVITKMYDELIKQMMACCKGVPCKDANCGFNPKSDLDCIEQLLTKAADAIEDLEKCLAIALLEYQRANNKLLITEEYARQKNRWIPVTERLPEYMENVLVTDGVFSGMGWRDWYDCHGTKPKEDCWIAPSTNVNELDITHWMPLPEPPEVET